MASASSKRDLGITQSDFARILGISRQRVNSLIRSGDLYGAAVEFWFPGEPPLIRMRTAVEQLRGAMLSTRTDIRWDEVETRLNEEQRQWQADLDAWDDETDEVEVVNLDEWDLAEQKMRRAAEVAAGVK